LLFGSPRARGLLLIFFFLGCFFWQVKKAYGFLRPDNTFEV